MIKRSGVRNQIVDNTCNGNCSRCGDCCGLFVPFNDDDVTNIKQYVKKYNIKPFDRIDRATGAFKAHCCFYDEVNKVCTIYEVRPYVCRDFICSRKNWKEKRDEYEKQAKYNSTLNGKQILATFDDIIFGDYEPVLRYIFNILYEKQKGNIDHKVLIGFLMQINRLDLLKYISVEDENGKKLNGVDLLKLID